jgi:hypothetical protein
MDHDASASEIAWGPPRQPGDLDAPGKPLGEHTESVGVILAHWLP